MKSLYDSLIEKYYDDFKEELTLENDVVNIIDAQRIMTIDEYLIFGCYKLQYWMNINDISKVCNIYEAMCKYIEYNNVEFDMFNEQSKIIFTCAKYYVKAVLKIKSTYNL